MTLDQFIPRYNAIRNCGNPVSPRARLDEYCGRRETKNRMWRDAHDSFPHSTDTFSQRALDCRIVDDQVHAIEQSLSDYRETSNASGWLPKLYAKKLGPLSTRFATAQQTYRGDMANVASRMKA